MGDFFTFEVFLKSPLNAFRIDIIYATQTTVNRRSREASSAEPTLTDKSNRSSTWIVQKSIQRYVGISLMMFMQRHRNILFTYGGSFNELYGLWRIEVSVQFWRVGDGRAWKAINTFHATVNDYS